VLDNWCEYGVWKLNFNMVHTVIIGVSVEILLLFIYKNTILSNFGKTETRVNCLNRQNLKKNRIMHSADFVCALKQQKP
jgi:hypothetical protein